MLSGSFSLKRKRFSPENLIESYQIAEHCKESLGFYYQFPYNIHHLVSSSEFAYVAMCIYQISSNVGIQGGFHKELFSS